MCVLGQSHAPDKHALSRLPDAPREILHLFAARSGARDQLVQVQRQQPVAVCLKARRMGLDERQIDLILFDDQSLDRLGERQVAACLYHEVFVDDLAAEQGRVRRGRDPVASHARFAEGIDR